MFSFGPYADLNRTVLLPELQKYLVGNRLQHPLLCFEYAFPGLVARLNRLYKHRLRGETQTSDTQNEWEKLRPDLSSNDRLKWIILEKIPCDHRIAGQIWTDPELLTNTCDVLGMLLGGLPPSGPLSSFMVDSERQRLAEFPDEIQVFRGHVPVLEHRSSWTLNPVVALDWACLRVIDGVIPNFESFNSLDLQFSTPVVTIGTVRKANVAAFVNRRGEDEILVDPQYVINRQSFEVTQVAGERSSVRTANGDGIEDDSDPATGA